MTKKHFIALADHIKEMQKTDEPLTQAQIVELAVFCQTQNPLFNRHRWLEYIAGTCGKNGGKVKVK